ncbi:MAG: hydrogenase maturation protease [Dehalococcoidia bacterium]|nr:MAG: hydrogenase maturation protease [Dehalococcoidia bacterium]
MQCLTGAYHPTTPKGELLEHIESAQGKTFHHNPRVTVLCIGNLLLKDEGVGIHLVGKLASNIDDVNVNIIDGGTSPDILSLVEDSVDKLIIVDAVKAGDKPGTIYRFSINDLDIDSEKPASLHEVGVLEGLRMMALLNRQPKSTVIIGIEPKTIDYGLELSPEVEEKLPEIVKLVLREVEETNKGV